MLVFTRAHLVALSRGPLLTRLMSTAASEGAAAGGSGFVRTEAGLQDLYMRALEPKPTPPAVVSADELERRKELGQTFSKLRMKRTAQREKDLKRKMDLKWAAFHVLPTVERKQEALFIQPRVPLHRVIPTATPPSLGFHGKSVQPPKAAKADAAPAAAASAAQAPSATAQRSNRATRESWGMGFGSGPNDAAAAQTKKGGKR